MKKRISLFVIAGIYALPFYLAFMNWQIYIWFVVGLVLGLVMMMADELIVYKHYVSQTSNALELITRSPLFLVAYPVLAFFAITSSNSALGIGLVLGLGLTMVVEALALRQNLPQLRQRFAQHLSPSLSDQDLLRGLWMGLVIFGGLSILVYV